MVKRLIDDWEFSEEHFHELHDIWLLASIDNVEVCLLLVDEIDHLIIDVFEGFWMLRELPFDIIRLNEDWTNASSVGLDI